VPEIECHIIEKNSPELAYGAKGVGEIVMIPTAPAVAAHTSIATESFATAFRSKTRLIAVRSQCGQARPGRSIEMKLTAVRSQQLAIALCQALIQSQSYSGHEDGVVERMKQAFENGDSTR
jgi:hypothetical protein